MNKDEILSKAIKENKIFDEGKVEIEKNSTLTACIVAITIVGVMLIISLTQRIQTGTSFADTRIFAFILLSTMSSKYLAEYYYNKKLKSIILGLAFLIVAFISIATYVM